ncbi:MAG: VCBS repeat-containing protein [Anaerolineae bacterium]|nr:VCBS repeat-containing protein [Anaerolineae bacterium]
MSRILPLIILMAGLSAPAASGLPVQAGLKVSGVVVSLGGTRVMRSTPAIADFNSDGMKEVVIGTFDGRLIVVGWSGSQWQKLWERQVALDINAAGPPNPQPQSRIESPIAVADLDQNGQLEIVVPVGGLPAHCINGGMLVYTYAYPWQFTLFGNWPQPKLDEVGGGPTWGSPDGCWDGIFSGAAVGDIDGDGDLEIVWEGEDRRIHAYHHTGAAVAGWPLHRSLGDPLIRGGISSPALGDIDGDGLLEIVVGGTSPLCLPLNGDPCAIADYSVAPVWAINGDSTLVPGWPKYLPQLVDSSPALGDLDGNGSLDVVVATGRKQIPNNDGKFVYAWRGNGDPLPGWPQPVTKWAQGSPALADLNADGGLDVTIGCGNMDDPDCYDLFAWRGNGVALSGFPLQPPSTHPSPSLLSTALSPVVADLDGNGQLDILMVAHNSPGVTVVRANGQPDPDVSRTQYAPLDGLYAPPAVADVDNDGLLETIVVGEVNGNAALYIWDEVGAATSNALPWPMHRHDNRRTGNYCFTELPPSSPTFFSTSVPTDTWTAQNNVTVWWAGATVGGPCPGIPSYSFAWTNSPTTIPDAIVDTASTNTTSPALSDGLWWFHLRTRDSWSNWSPNVIHIGPFKVDRTPPTLAFATSTTPTVNVWSNSDRITVTLAPALDTGSGLSGYAVLWDQSPLTLPGPTQNVTAVSGLSHGPISGAGLWYLHVRSVDRLGNWSPDAAHFGPFRIDREPPNLPSVVAASPLTNVWTAATTLQVSLVAGGDIGSGTNGYSFVWDTVPHTIPDAVLDTGPVSILSAATTATVADWYLHLRSVDNVGNSSLSTLHYGPFKVDRVPPGIPSVITSSPAVSTWSNASHIILQLNPAIDPGSGLDGYSVVWDAVPTTQPDAVKDIGPITNISSATTANTVMSWYAHLRAFDLVGNVATATLHYGPFRIDRVPPDSHLIAPPTVPSDAPIPLSWSGSDIGSGIAGYDTQVRSLPTGTWTTWLSNVLSTTLGAAYVPHAPACGQRYEFRLRARDVAGNLQAGWSPSQSTLLTSRHPISSVVVNSLGQLVYAAQVASADACAVLPSDMRGRAYAYFNSSGVYSISVSHSDFGSLPVLRDRPTRDRQILVVLPPKDNVVTNSHFETTDGWSFSGAAGYTSTAHSGIGGAVISGTGVISQRVTVPAQGVLSVLARVRDYSPHDSASVRVQVEGSLLPLEYKASEPVAMLASMPLIPALTGSGNSQFAPLAESGIEDWRHVKLDLRAAAGLPVVIIIQAVDVEPSGLNVIVDEVTLGAPAGGVHFSYLPSSLR